MDIRAVIAAVIKFLAGIVAVGLLIFLPAGTIFFFNGWLLMGIVFVPMLVGGVVMMFKNPDLLKRRLDAKETQQEQRTVVKWSGLMFAAGFIVAGLGVRWDWYTLPQPVVMIAAVVCLGSYGLYAEVLRENTYLSRTIEVQDHQKVIDTGLYGLVRHPMYSATLLMFLSMPLVLGSVYSFVIFSVYPLIIARRIKHEEAFLEKELDGYRAYMQKVTYRLIPFIW